MSGSIKKSVVDTLLGRRASDELPAKCCGRCAHGREVKDPASLQTLVMCKAGPASVTMIPLESNGQRGFMAKSGWPVLQQTEDCDAFLAKTDHKDLS